MAAPPRAAVHAAKLGKSKEACREAADVGEDPEAAVRVPLGEAEPDAELDTEAEEDAEERALVTMEDAAEEDEEAEEAAVEVACEEGAEVVAPAPASWVGILVKQDEAPGSGVVTVRVSERALPSPLGRKAKISKAVPSAI